MALNSILLQHEARMVALLATASQLRFGQMLALALFATALVAILILLFFSTVKHSLPVAITLIPVPLAVYAANTFKIRKSSLLKTLQLTNFYHAGIARLNGTWPGSGDTGERFLPKDHAGLNDLNLIGTGSLFQLLCTCRTEAGRSQLAHYLLTPITLQEALTRQNAVKELISRTDIHEQLSVLGEHHFQETSAETITGWLHSPTFRAHPFFQPVAFIISAILAALVLLGWDRAIAWSDLIIWIAALSLASALLGLVYRNRLLAATQDIRAVGMDLNVLSDGLKLMQQQHFNSELLTHLVEVSRKDDPPRTIRKLARLINAFVERDKEWFYLLSRALLFGTQMFVAIEQWRQNHGPAMERWLSAWGDFEALAALSNYAYEHPENTFPKLSTAETIFDAHAIRHPLLPPSQCVPNRIALNPQTRFIMISGSNMAGKSTLLRTIGLNVSLAYAGTSVCAERFHLSQFQLCASFAIQDSLLDGKSKFLAEIHRIRFALSIPTDQSPVLFLIDELLSGTNSRYRRLAAEAILKELLKRGAMGAISTHDLALTEIPLLAGFDGMNMHMSAPNPTDPLSFDYLLKPGVNQHCNALAIAQLAGVPL